MKPKLTLIILTAVITTVLLMGLSYAFSWSMQHKYGGPAKTVTEIIPGRGVLVHYQVTNDQAQSMEILIKEWKRSPGATQSVHPMLSTNRLMPGEAISIGYPWQPKGQ